MSRIVEKQEEFREYVRSYCPPQQKRLPEEIEHGVLIPSNLDAQIFNVQAQTSSGWWSLWATNKVEIQQFLLEMERWQGTCPSFLIAVPESKFRAHDDRGPSTHVDCDKSAQDVGDWARTASGVLTTLESNVDEATYLNAVLFAEVTSFDDEQTQRVMPILRRFVEKNRFSTSDDVMTAVGAAIRKYAMNAPYRELDEFGELLASSTTETVPCEVELEVCKSLVWRFASQPPATDSEFPRLTTRVREVVTAYLSPRLILQKNYAAVVLNGVLLALMVGRQACEDLLAMIDDLGLPWFEEQFDRRRRELRRKLRTEHSSNVANRLGSE